MEILAEGWNSRLGVILERRSARSINVCERMDEPWRLPAEVMCRVQREKTWYSGQRGCILPLHRARAKMEILGMWDHERSPEPRGSLVTTPGGET